MLGNLTETYAYDVLGQQVGSITMTFLRDIAKVEACYPFRGRITNDPDGDVKVIQMKDVSPERGIDWTSLFNTKLPGRRSPNFLKEGNIIFLSRGTQNFAVSLDEVPARAVCSPLFFRILTKTDHILPGFLAWLINQRGAQEYLKRQRMGTHQLSIRRRTLEELPISIPSIEIQKKIINLDRIMKEEQRAYRDLSEKNARMMQALSQDILAGKIR